MTASLTQAKILVIDDFQGMRTMLRDFVKAMGVTQVDTAANGREALSQLRSHRYNIVICDFNLGQGQNGQQVLDEARMRDYIGVSTIWVMVTAEKTTDMVMGAAEVKPDDEESRDRAELLAVLAETQTPMPIDPAAPQEEVAVEGWPRRRGPRSHLPRAPSGARYPEYTSFTG